MIENSSDFALFSAKPKMHKHSSGCFLASAQLMFICGVRARWWVVGGGGWSGDGTFDIILSTGPAAFQGSSCSGAGSRHQSHRADKGTGSGGRGLLPLLLHFPACASRPACVPFATFPRSLSSLLLLLLLPLTFTLTLCPFLLLIPHLQLFPRPQCRYLV